MNIEVVKNYLGKDQQIKKDSYTGLLIAAVIIILWFVNIIFFLTTVIFELPFILILFGILLQTFLYTGLFITAHDAMHRAVFRLNHALNDSIGRVALILYALFSYKKLLKKHWEHHRKPGTEADPDFHAEDAPQFIRWYTRFMFHYLSILQIIGMAVLFNVLQHVLNIPAINLVLFWVIPALLSTLQLFYFGTFFPHRKNGTEFPDTHHSRSNNFSTLLSFLSCYHFGYHWEHHEYPYLPWWRLPQSR